MKKLNAVAFSTLIAVGFALAQAPAAKKPPPAALQNRVKRN
jgi:hypothetical protein